MEENVNVERENGRAADQLRPISLKKGIAPAADGSVLISCGRTQVLCAASIDEAIPGWMRAQNLEQGWLTAEYSLLPCSTSPRARREVTAGKVGGRTQEIQRLIGRSLRAVVDMKKLGKRTIWVDCDVIQADGGTRTAAITGGFVAVRMAVNKLLAGGVITEDPISEGLAAISVGVVQGVPVLDLDYSEDCGADVDMNVVMTSSGQFVEVQGSAEGQPFSKTHLDEMLQLAQQGIAELWTLQAAAVAEGG